MQSSFLRDEPASYEIDPHKVYTKGSLIETLREIRRQGWIPNARPGNPGGVGNTLEDLLGIEENNIPLANAGEWELKAQRAGTTSLITLFHMEPWPREVRVVPRMLLPKYGWPHQKAGIQYASDEMSFRQTIHGASRSDRGFTVVVDRVSQKVLISFDASAVDTRHSAWLADVDRKVGSGELNPQPYWDFAKLLEKAQRKLGNCFFVQAKVKREEGLEYFHYDRMLILQEFSLDSFVLALERSDLRVDFDARTGHNHGTKFRLRQDRWPVLYDSAEET